MNDRMRGIEDLCLGDAISYRAPEPVMCDTHSLDIFCNRRLVGKLKVKLDSTRTFDEGARNSSCRPAA